MLQSSPSSVATPLPTPSFIPAPTLEPVLEPAIEPVPEPAASASMGWRPMAQLCLALLAVSFAPIFIRFSETDLGANATVFNRMLVFLVVFSLGQGLRQLGRKWHADINLAQYSSASTDPASPPRGPRITRTQWLLLGAVGLASVTTLGLWAVSLQYTSVAKSMLLNNLTPVFASAGGWLFLGKRFDLKFIVGIAIAVAGAILLGLEDVSGGDVDSLVGDAYALLSAVFLGAYFLLAEQLRTRFDSTTILFSRCAVGVLLLLPLVTMVEDQLLPSTGVSLLAVLGLGIVSEGMGQNLLADSMAKFSCSFIALFLLLEPIVSALLSWMIFGEQLSTITGVGFVTILGGIYIAQSSPSATQTTDH